MSLQSILWLTLGTAAGVTHAVALWRASHASTGQGLSAVWRLPVVAAVLVAAAVAHALVAAGMGWTTGLTLTGAWYLARRRRWT